MPTVGAELDKVQAITQDTAVLGQDGLFWSRAELLAWFEDAYRTLLAETTATRRFTVVNVPPEFTWSVTHEWERAFTQDGAAFPWAHQTEGGWAASSLWEIEQLEGITPTASGIGFTHPHERQFANADHIPFRFAVPRDTERVIKIWHDHRLLIPISTRSLDAMETNWLSLEGNPIAWTRGTGHNRTFEVFEIVTGDTRTYRYKDGVSNDANPLHGTLRQMTGDRTYTWTSDSDDTIPYGIARRLSSPDRQYVPRVDEPQRAPLGRAGWVQSSSDSLLILEARIPDAVTLREEDEPVLLPPQMAKYIRWGVLARAFGRQGEGFDGLLSTFYEQRFARGLRFLRRLHHLARKDRRAQREPVQPGRRRPPRVRLPSNYPRVLPP